MYHGLIYINSDQNLTHLGVKVRINTLGRVKARAHIFILRLHTGFFFWGEGGQPYDTSMCYIVHSLHGARNCVTSTILM